MGAGESKARKVSFGLDEEEKVTVIQGVTLSEDVLHRMRDAQRQSESVKPSAPPPAAPKPAQAPKPAEPMPTGPTFSEAQEELRQRFEKEHALVQEQLAALAKREREVLPTGPDNQQDTMALLRERAKNQEQLEKTKLLPAEVDVWTKQLERKENELLSVSAFYKEQLQLMEKKSVENYEKLAEQYNQAATKAEATIQPRPTSPICPDLQSQVFQCYKENRLQSLHCSALARDYQHCVQQAKKSLLINHG